MQLLNGRLRVWTWSLQYWICPSARGLARGLASSEWVITYSVSPILITFYGSDDQCDSCKMKLAIVHGTGSGLLCQLIYWGSHCEITCGDPSVWRLAPVSYLSLFSINICPATPSIHFPSIHHNVFVLKATWLPSLKKLYADFWCLNTMLDFSIQVKYCWKQIVFQTRVLDSQAVVIS